jgi:hypothetical protein
MENEDYDLRDAIEVHEVWRGDEYWLYYINADGEKVLLGHAKNVECPYVKLNFSAPTEIA